MDSNMFQRNINYLLKNKKINVTTILKITGHNSSSLVSMWRTGQRKILTEDAIKIANYLNITIDELLNKDLSTASDNDELTSLFIKNVDILTNDDKQMIKFIIEKRIIEKGKE